MRTLGCEPCRELSNGMVRMLSRLSRGLRALEVRSVSGSGGVVSSLLELSSGRTVVCGTERSLRNFGGAFS